MLERHGNKAEKAWGVNACVETGACCDAMLPSTCTPRPHLHAHTRNISLDIHINSHEHTSNRGDTRLALFIFCPRISRLSCLSSSTYIRTRGQFLQIPLDRLVCCTHMLPALRTTATAIKTLFLRVSEDIIHTTCPVSSMNITL